jgi:Zn-dependent protease
MRGAFPLFRLAGIQVYLHFLWFIVAFFEFSRFSRRYHSPIWGVLEYLTLFLIVLIHEFGHALACRQTGGKADQIMLWPFGGVAFVSPPQRPGAYLWSIAAGPLVNVILFPILTLLGIAVGAMHLKASYPDAARFIVSIWSINTGLLVFNLLPIYPLDGGQLFRGVLWIWLGRVRSLRVASIVGLAGAIGLGLLAFLYLQSGWLVLLAVFIFTQAQFGWRQAQQLQLEVDAAERARAAAVAPGQAGVEPGRPPT